MKRISLLILVLLFTSCSDWRLKNSGNSSENELKNSLKNERFIFANNQDILFYFDGDIMFDSESIRKLSDPNFKIDLNGTRLCQYGNWMYYMPATGGISRIDLKTRKTETIYSERVDFVYGEENIYFDKKEDGVYCVYKMDYEGGNIEKISDDNKCILAASHTNLYFGRGREQVESELLESDLDGNNVKSLYFGKNIFGYFQVFDNELYFGLNYDLYNQQGFFGKSLKLYYRVSNSEIIKISDEITEFILKVDNTIIFYGPHDKFSIYDLKTGKIEKYEISGMLQTMFCHENTVYYYRVDQDNNKLFCKYDVEKREEIIITPQVDASADV